MASNNSNEPTPPATPNSSPVVMLGKRPEEKWEEFEDRVVAQLIKAGIVKPEKPDQTKPPA